MKFIFEGDHHFGNPAAKKIHSYPHPCRLACAASIFLLTASFFLPAMAFSQAGKDAETLYLQAYEKVKEEQAQMEFKSLPKISTHEPYCAGGNWEEFFQVMDHFGIEKAVWVPTGHGPDNQGYEKKEEILAYQDKYADRIMTFATVDGKDPKAPRVLEGAVKKGARGLKLIWGPPAFLRWASGQPQHVPHL